MQHYLQFRTEYQRHTNASMANSTNQGGSPKEDFNPLNDYL